MLGSCMVGGCHGAQKNGPTDRREERLRSEGDLFLNLNISR